MNTIVDEDDCERVTNSLRYSDFQPSAASLSSPNVAVSDGGLWQSEILSAEASALANEFTGVYAADRSLSVVPVSNGTRAITLTLTALAAHSDRLGLRTPRLGDNVIVPSLTWSATATAVLERGLVPRLADVDMDTMALSPESIRHLIDDRTFGIVAVHLYNRMANVTALRGIADQYGLALIEDCAHAHGASWGRAAAGLTGHAGTFSLQASKPLTSGEGGLVVSTDDELLYQVASLANCGRPCRSALPLPAGNDRLPTLSAAFARSQLTRFSARQAARIELWRSLDEIAATSDVAQPFLAQDGSSPTYKWAARYPEHDVQSLATHLTDELGVEVGRTYTPLHRNATYRPELDPFMGQLVEEDRDRYSTTYPNSEELYDTVLTVAHDASTRPEFAPAYETALNNIGQFLNKGAA